MTLTTSPKGKAFLEAHEGVVLKAYRCPADRWTIGSGLTAASGVIVPKAGMTITRQQATELLGKALARNYEPRVNKAFSGHVARQHEFDGATSFDFNTGAINRASWIKAWRAGDEAKVRSGLMAWVKGGGKVLPGLQRRRREEADVIILDKWPAGLNVVDTPAPAEGVRYAVFVISVSPEEIAAIRDGFRTIGFNPGMLDGMVLREPVEDFQRRYDLTVDGKIGRATLSTLQRELDARAATKAGGAVAAGGTVTTGGAETAPADALPSGIDPEWVSWIGFGVAVLAALYLAWLAWRYRDMIAARIARRLPRAAAWLRSF